MQKKGFIAVLLSIILFLAIGVLGVANVFRIDGVSLISNTISSTAQVEAAQLQEELNNKYIRQNALFVDQSEADAILQKFPYFRITSFRKEFPNRLVVEVKEDEEMFAIETSSGYKILSADGILLGNNKSTSENRTGSPNILVKGLALEGELGKVVSGNGQIDGFVCIVRAMAAADGMGGSLRSNVLEIEVAQSPMPQQMTLKMKEGVTAYVYDFDEDSVQKAILVVQTYLGLQDSQKVTGKILVGKTVDGLSAEYFAN